LEEGLVLVAGDVLGDVRAGALAVAHLAEDTSARAGDAFDGLERSVGIELDAARGRAGGVAILEGDLAVLDEVGDDGRVIVKGSGRTFGELNQKAHEMFSFRFRHSQGTA
jgi:hypothetical protein